MRFWHQPTAVRLKAETILEHAEERGLSTGVISNDSLAGGMAEDAIVKDFPDLTRDDIRAVLAFAASRERRVANSVA